MNEYSTWSFNFRIPKYAKKKYHLLGHIKQSFIMVQPQIMVRNAHFMEGNFLGILKKAIGSPNVVQPLHIQDPVLLVHIFW